MKRATQIIVFFFVTGALSVIVYSCCTKVNKIIGLFRVEVSHTDTIYPVLTDTVFGEIEVSVFALVANVGFTDFQGFISTANAFSCEYEYVNEFKPETFRWTSDLPFVLDGNLIVAGANIPVPSEVQIYSGDAFAPSFSWIIPQAFLDSAVFQREWHTFNLHIETTDGQAFETSVRLFMQL